MRTITKTAKIKETALPKCQSPTLINCCSIKLPIREYCPPPNNFGITNEEIAGKNTIVIPVNTPPNDNLKVIFQKVVIGFAPRSLLASTKDLSILVKAV